MKVNIKEVEVVALVNDSPDDGLVAGRVGTGNGCLETTQPCECDPTQQSRVLMETP